MPQFVDVPDIAPDYVLLMVCAQRITCGTGSNCVHELERLARESQFEGVRASAFALLRRIADDTQEIIRPETSAEQE
jgi:hypothetical protein